MKPQLRYLGFSLEPDAGNALRKARAIGVLVHAAFVDYEPGSFEDMLPCELDTLDAIAELLR